MISKPLFAILMVALLLGFGNSCICVVDDNGEEQENGDGVQESIGTPSSGCQQPIHTQGLPRPDEYTVVIKVFPSEVSARGFSQKLREDRIHNYCYPQSNGCWVVSVGRYWDAKPAQKMLNKLVFEFGYSKAKIRKPGDKDIECREHH